MLSLNEALKAAGLPTQQLNEASAVSRVREAMGKIETLQKVFTGNLRDAIEREGGDASYVDDIVKSLNKIEDDIGELQRSMDRGEE